MSIDLYFDLAATLRLAEHAAAAHDNVPSFSESEAGQKRGVPALQWVADWGTYLISNGMPGLPGENASQRNFVVFADGWGADSNRYELAVSGVGHDDFVEHLPLHDGTPSLLTLLRCAHERGFAWFVLKVNTETVAYRVSETKPAT